MKKAELVFIPSPGLSHLISTVEMAKLLLDRDDRLSITVLIMKLSKDHVVDSYTENISSNPNITKCLRFINLPHQDESSISTNFLFDIIDSQITNVREIVSNLIKNQSESDSRVAGLVLDMFCTKFMEVGDEFNLPSYVFFTSSAGSLGLIQFLDSLKHEHNYELTQFKNSDAEFSVPCFSIPVPAKMWPAVILQEGQFPTMFLNCFRRIKEAKGVMVNTFYELEPFAMGAHGVTETPRVYPVGPILNLGSDQTSQASYNDIKKWLDDQPEISVVFLCFGSMGSFEEGQVKEIALALENSGKKFLWSLRKPGGEQGFMSFPAEYENFQEVLPKGFLERTEGIGKVIGWAPQMEVLSHPSVGGFVSHCGWNSVLESVWFGVPMATFPLYAEQQVNAFELVKELRMAEAVRIDYHSDSRGGEPPEIVGAEEIEAAIRRLMAEEEGRSGVREKVKEMKNKSRMALMEGGSSYNAQNLFIEHVLRNIS
ncbi:hypothetical protein BUALT_Bualt03G0215700 [Buddleja alternifolia]|uniref:Glycosyltransferase n=1 Tax=Buddleja alternifolia TaxID=168488 RepID=A0AAV6Y2H1_9LAMI|nr:hypothetical protein BUALT_Bualt03G0215700 [Buddleja alternifolia]